jgi:hypothetical protein
VCGVGCYAGMADKADRFVEYSHWKARLFWTGYTSWLIPSLRFVVLVSLGLISSSCILIYFSFHVAPLEFEYWLFLVSAYFFFNFDTLVQKRFLGRNEIQFDNTFPRLQAKSDKMVNWILPMRGVQAVLSVTVLGLMAYGQFLL